MTYFKGKIGEEHVENHKYIISTKDGKLSAEPDNWDLVVKKGTVLVMSMIVEMMEEETALGTCPQCGETDLGVMADEGWLHW